VKECLGLGGGVELMCSLKYGSFCCKRRTREVPGEKTANSTGKKLTTVSEESSPDRGRGAHWGGGGEVGGSFFRRQVEAVQKKEGGAHQKKKRGGGNEKDAHDQGPNAFL